METLSIKDLILDGGVVEKEAKPRKQKRASEYEVVTVSGPDFAVRRKGSNPKLLVVLPSMKQFYIKNEREGVNEVLTLDNLKKFLAGIPADSNLSLEDKNGVFPFWIRSLERSKEFAVRFMNAIELDSFLFYCTKDMVSFEYFSDARALRDSKYEFKKVKIVFDALVEYAGRQTAKESFTNSFSMYYRLREKHDTLFSSMFEEVYERYHRYGPDAAYYGRNRREYGFPNNTLYDWLDKQWGWEGIRSFIRAYLESPVSVLANNLADERLARNNFGLHEFIDYVFNECTKQGYADDPSNFIQSWVDSIIMQNEIYGKIVEKYPDNLASFEKSLSYKYNKLQEAKEIENFDISVEVMKKYEGEIDGKYIVICPKSPRDMIEEGQMQSNCVGSYVKRVADGDCMVFFMRSKIAPEKSLVTIEVRDGALIQVKARFNRKPTEEQRQAVDKWFEKMFLSPEQLTFLGGE